MTGVCNLMRLAWRRSPRTSRSLLAPAGSRALATPPPLPPPTQHPPADSPAAAAPTDSTPEDAAATELIGWAGFLTRKTMEFKVGFSIGGMLDANPPDVPLLCESIRDLSEHRYSRELLAKQAVPLKLARIALNASDISPALLLEVVETLDGVGIGELCDGGSASLTKELRDAVDSCAELCAYALNHPTLRDDAALTQASCVALLRLAADGESAAQIVALRPTATGGSPLLPIATASVALHAERAVKQAARRAKRAKAKGGRADAESSAGTSDAARNAAQELCAVLSAPARCEQRGRTGSIF